MFLQDDVDQKSIAFAVNSSKFTGNNLLKLAKYMISKAKNLESELKNPTVKHGKQSVRRLGKQNQGMTSVEISNKNIKCFERYAKKYGVDFALKVDKSQDPPKYMVFFKARDEEAIQNALKDFAKARMRKSFRPSVRDALNLIIDELKLNLVARKLSKVMKKNRGGFDR